VTRLYACQNEGVTGVTYQRGTATPVLGAGGFCFGYSLVWAARMQKHPDKPKLSKPQKFEAGPLQQKVEQLDLNWAASVQKVARDRGLGCEAPVTRVWDLLPAYIARSSGYYVVDIGDHWIGMGAGPNGWYFFDANSGLEEFSDETDFINYAVQNVRRYRDDPDPANAFENVHKAYKIIA